MRIAGRHRRIDADPVDSGIAEIALVQHAGTARKTDDRTTGKTNFQCSNDPTEGLPHLESCIRLDPQGIEAAPRLMQTAVALYFSKQYKEAVVAAERVIHLHPEHRLSLIWLAAALGQAGRTEEAREAL